MNVSLIPQREERIRTNVESGMEGNASEVVREALRLMDRKDRLDRLRADIAEADAEFDRGEFLEDTPALWEQVQAASERMEREGIAPDPDVCP